MKRIIIAIVGMLISETVGMGWAEEVTLNYPLERIVPRDQWRLDAWGDRGATAWDGKKLTADFSKGAGAVLLRFPDRSLPGTIKKIRIEVNGSAAGHPVSLHLHTHFMTFSKSIGEIKGQGKQVIEIDGPPSEGWTWHGGENDGRIHGPIRLAELRFESGDKNTVELVFESIQIIALAPIDRQVILTARKDSTDTGLCFAADLRGFSDEPIAGKLIWSLRRWDGQTLAEGGRDVRIPAGLKTLTESIDAPSLPGECRFVEAEFSFEAVGQKVSPVYAYWMGKFEPNKDLTLRPESPFGMGVYLNRFGPEEMERVAKLAGQAGVKWSREDFGWGHIEPQPGQFRWEFTDRILDVATRNGITVYAIVAYWPGWSKGYTQEGVQQYAEFLRVLVRRYKDRVKHWEIWNEPNIFFWQGPKELYADLLIAAYKAIKEEDPSAQVLGISTAGIDYGFIADMLKRNTPFDILTIHPYRKVLKDGDFIADLAKVSDQVKLPDGTHRPVWITEMGWATHVPHHVLGQDFAPNSQKAQASFLARSYLCTIASGVQPRTFWYNFRNDGDDPFYFEHNMGIVQIDGTPKPAYLAYATMTRVLGNRKFVRKRDDLGEVFAAEFAATDGSSQKVLAVWSAEKDLTVKIPVASKTITLINTIGESRPLESSNGQIELNLKAGLPVYLVM